MEENKKQEILEELVEVFRKHDLTVDEAAQIENELYRYKNAIVDSKKF